jgi:hypothetical protein
VEAVNGLDLDPLKTRNTRWKRWRLVYREKVETVKPSAAEL